MDTSGNDLPPSVGSEPAGFGSAAGDHEEFARLFESWRPHLLRVCGGILRRVDNAPDAVQETYLRAFRHRSGFDGDNLPGWLSKIARHVCIDWIRREAISGVLGVGIEQASTNNEVRILTALQIRSILKELPENQRRCLKLFYIEGYTATEVAKSTGFTGKQVKSYLQNGRRNFMHAWRAVEKQS